MALWHFWHWLVLVLVFEFVYFFNNFFEQDYTRASFLVCENIFLFVTPIFLNRIVESGHRAIKFNRISGVGAEIYSEGYHFAVPILERPIIYDIRTRANSITSLTGSKDLQMVNLTVRVLHKPNEKQLSKMYRELGMNYAERVLPSLGNEVLKSVVVRISYSAVLLII